MRVNTCYDTYIYSLIIEHVVQGTAWVCAVLPPCAHCTNPLLAGFYSGEYQAFHIHHRDRRFTPRS